MWRFCRPLHGAGIRLTWCCQNIKTGNNVYFLLGTYQATATTWVILLLSSTGSWPCSPSFGASPDTHTHRDSHINVWHWLKHFNSAWEFLPFRNDNLVIINSSHRLVKSCSFLTSRHCCLLCPFTKLELSAMYGVTEPSTITYRCQKEPGKYDWFHL